MMDTSEPCVPPGFRFHPTDEELVGYYLRKKIASQKIDLVIKDIDLYRIEPWDLQDKCRIGYEEQNEWYFFSHKDKKYPTGTRTNRATMAGFWKATGRDKAVYEKHRLIGMRKTLVFYKGRAPNGQKTDWIMHEYRLESDENAPPQEEGWVVCKAFKKRSTGQIKSTEGWDSTYCYDHEPTGLSSIMDSVDYITRQPQSVLPQSNFMCKQAILQAEESLNILHGDPFVELPQLQSPSLPLMKRPSSSISLVSENKEEEDQKINNGLCNNSIAKKVTDWRDLDKFVASQLSHDEERVVLHEGDDSVSRFHHDQSSSDLGLLLLQSSREEADKLNGFLGSSSDYGLGICIFDK